MGTTITNPVINGPYDEPRRHFRFDDDGITDDIVDGRRRSEYFVPVPQTKKRGAQLQFDNEWTLNRIKPNEFVNDVRDPGRPVAPPGLPPCNADHPPPARVLGRHRPREPGPVLPAGGGGDGDLPDRGGAEGPAGLDAVQADEYNAEFNSGLPRQALKMATGSGKTVVMAMLIAWQTLNKAANRQDRRFTNRFLVVAPGVTIRDRLRVLLPEHPDNYYRERDLVPADLVPTLSRRKIVITNFHVFLPKVTKEGAGLARATKDLLLGGKDDPTDPFVESPQQVATRVAREFDLRSGEIVVLNDEAHHCYRDKPADRIDGDMDADEKAEAKEREEEARVWFKGLQGLQAKLGIKTVYDLSATPFFLNGSGYGQGTLFPWVVSDFSLVDAIECGIVKVPRLPVDDDSIGEQVVYRNLWDEISQDLPKRAARAAKTRPKSRTCHRSSSPRSTPSTPTTRRRSSAGRTTGEPRGETPPVFIVVCNNTTVSKLVFDWIAGFDKETKDLDGNDVTVPSGGNLALFRNIDNDAWVTNPRTIIVDSAQLESGDQLTAEFKALAARQIEEFKDEIRLRFPGRDPDEITEADLLREVMNTVGKPASSARTSAASSASRC